MEKKQLIWTCDSLSDEDARKAYQESRRECPGDEEHNVTDEEWADEVSLWLDDERANLNKEVNGVIVAFADLGLWHGRRQGYKIIGRNIADILRSSHDAEWFGDTYNIRGVEYHHDGTNYILYRVAKDMEAAERITEKIYSGEVDEAQFRKMTRSLHPYVAEIYGWKTRCRKCV
ncbi:MAG: hypothetical protein J6C10_06755 [Prevotella sp.]|nr:hypothetical protein [Prevotella sp.]